MVTKWLGNRSENAARFDEQLQSVPALESLMRTPLLATLVILVFRQTGRLPESKTRLYEIFIDLLSGGWDIAKGILRESKFGQRIKTMILKTLAWGLHEKRKREFNNDELKVAMQSTFSNSLFDEWKIFRDEIVEDGLIVRSGNIMQFPHLSFQEFLTAKDYVGAPQPTRINRALEAFLLGDDWWREVIRFYIGLSGKPREITEWLLLQIQQNINTKYKSIPHTRIDDLLLGILESFPEFPLKDIAHYAFEKLDYQGALINLKQAQRESQLAKSYRY